MKTFFFAFVFLLGNIAFAQPEKEVEMAVEKLRLAMIDPAQDVLAKLTSTDLSYGHSNGLIENQNAFMEALVAGKSDFKTIIISDQSIKLNGKSVAIVRHKFKGELVAADGNINTVNLSILMVWIKEKGAWKLLARQAVRL